MPGRSQPSYWEEIKWPELGSHGALRRDPNGQRHAFVWDKASFRERPDPPLKYGWKTLVLAVLHDHHRPPPCTLHPLQFVCDSFSLHPFTPVLCSHDLVEMWIHLPSELPKKTPLKIMGLAWSLKEIMDCQDVPFSSSSSTARPRASGFAHKYRHTAVWVPKDLSAKHSAAFIIHIQEQSAFSIYQ